MSLITLGLSVAGIAVTPLGFIGKSAYKNYRDLTHKVDDLATAYAVHAASDAATFKAIETTLSDIKNEQRDQTNKLDRIVERVL